MRLYYILMEFITDITIVCGGEREWRAGLNWGFDLILEQCE